MLRAGPGTFAACSSLEEIIQLRLKVKIYNMYIFTKCDRNVVMYHVVVRMHT